MNALSIEPVEKVDTEQKIQKGDQHFAHIVNPPANMHIQATVGKSMTAMEIVAYARDRGVKVVCLCGYVFIPQRDPDNLPACQICIDVAHMLMRNAGQ